MNSEALNRVYKLLGGGALAAVIGFGLFIFFGGLGSMAYVATRNAGGLAVAGLGLLIGILGLCTCLYGLVVGLQEAMGDDKKKPISSVPGSYIISKLVLNDKNEPVFDVDMYEPDEIKYLVQVHFPNGRKEELTTHPITFGTIGEGMKGTVTYQGKWLSRFEPELRPHETPQGDPIPPDPFANHQL